MFGMGKAKPFDRQEVLRAAEAYRAKGKTQKAAEQLLLILENDPKDAEIHQKLAPMLVTLGDHVTAAKSFRVAADALLAKGISDRALAIYLQVVEYQPNDTEVWETIAKIQLERGRRVEAVKVLADGATKQRGRHRRARSVRLLQCALAIDSENVPIAVDAAKLLAKEGRKPEAKELLQRLVVGAQGPALKKLRRAQLSVSPTPASLWRYLRA